MSKQILLLIGATLLLIPVTIVTMNRFNQSRGITSQQPRQQRDASPTTSGEWPILWGPPNQTCEQRDVRFTASPVSVTDISFIEPMGELKQGHIAPGDHIGINYETSPTSRPVTVYAPADGYIATIERHPYTPPSGYPQDLHHYHVYLVHSCTLFTGYVHVTDLDPALLNASAELKTLHAKNAQQFENIAVRIPVKAGQPIGTAWSFGLLGMVTADLNHLNTGYLNPSSYRSENWRIHAVAPFDYMTPSLRTQLLAKNPRTVEPRGGKIDFDMDGKLIGNWFEIGTGGFRDESKAPRQCGNFPCPYWEGHLALVYDYIDPQQLRVSIGYDAGLGEGTPYGVKGNGPNFQDIGVANGLVKYELVPLQDMSAVRGYITEDPLIEVSDETRVLGTLLVQVLENHTLKAEVFPGKMKEQVNEFTPAARVYKR